MEAVWIVLITTVSFLSMEIAGWSVHRFVMHGIGWTLHKDHHMPANSKIEKNDLFALIFAAPSIILFILSSLDGLDEKFWIAVGIASYGVVYFLYHDVLIHQRLKLFSKARSKYIKSVVEAHLDHHRGKKNYGFLFMIPWRYFREEPLK